jgi:glycosyltransferase involved in cell wall biosynthesis
VARNAEVTYKPILSSLREFADRGGDLVLVDTGSSDRTKTIYGAFGFRIYDVGDRFQQSIPDDVRESVNARARELGDPDIIPEGATFFNFADARNYAASLAENDYIVNIDADECLSVFDIDKCEEAFALITRFRYDFVFNHRPDGTPWLEFVTDTRASDRRHWQWRGIVHETNEPIGDGNHNIGYIPPNVFKVEHWQVESPTRSNYLAGLAYACHAEPGNDRNSHYYGRELMYRGFYRSAIEELKRHLTISTWDLEKSQSMIFIADSFLNLGREAEAIEWYHKSLALHTRREPLLRLAILHKSKDHFVEAAAYTAAALEIPMVDFYGKFPDYYGYVPHEIMYWSKWWLGDRAASKEHWKKAHELCPHNEKITGDGVFYESGDGR